MKARTMARPNSLTQAASWRWAGAGLLAGALAATVAFAPARWLAGWVNQTSGGRALLQDARGTVWDGSALLTLAGGPGSLDAATLPSRLQWQVRPGLTSLQLHWMADCCLTERWTWQLQPQWGGARLSLSDARSSWPAQWLSGLGTPFNTLALQGQLALTTQGLTLNWSAGRLHTAGSAQLQALDLSSRLSTLEPMGSYRLAFAGASASSLQLDTLAGPLQLSGQGQWEGGKLQFNGEATCAPEHQAALANLLNIIGRRSGARSIIKLG